MIYAIADACGQVVSGAFDGSFVVEALQGGAGTSTHMNVNEVIAAAASEAAGVMIHPIDGVNRGQSTNDVYPAALRIAVVRLLRRLSDACAHLQETANKGKRI